MATGLIKSINENVLVGVVLLMFGIAAFSGTILLPSESYGYWVSSEQVYEQTADSIETATPIGELSDVEQEMVYDSLDSTRAHIVTQESKDIPRNQVVNVNGVYYSVTVDGPTERNKDIFWFFASVLTLFGLVVLGSEFAFAFYGD